MNFFRHLRAAWAYGKVYPYEPWADNNWNNDDAARTLAYFSSPAGQKFKARLTNFLAQSAIAAAMNPNRDTRPDAQAAGIAAVIAFTEAHMVQVGEQEQEQTDMEEAPA